jgi:hypothetical protein
VQCCRTALCSNNVRTAPGKWTESSLNVWLICTQFFSNLCTDESNIHFARERGYLATFFFPDVAQWEIKKFHEFLLNVHQHYETSRIPSKRSKLAKLVLSGVVHLVLMTTIYIKQGPILNIRTARAHLSPSVGRWTHQVRWHPHTFRVSTRITLPFCTNSAGFERKLLQVSSLSR